MPGLPVVSRRQLLLGVGAVAAAAVAGCAGVEPQPRQHVHTVASLLAASPFYIAHRGSGDNWTEHTMQAYQESVAHGMAAIEVSVNATSDGVFVCHHDTNLRRSAGDERKISELSFSELSTIAVDARKWLGPAAAPQAIPQLRDVLDAMAGTHVIFLEDKQGTNTTALLDLMDQYPDSTNHLIWKQSSKGAHTAQVKSRGYRVWGYFDADQRATFADVVPALDLAGLSVDADDDAYRELVAMGKPVIAWEVHTRSQRDRLAALGVQGMMCSNILYVREERPGATSDAFGTGLRAAGDLPWALDKGWGVQPALDPGAGTISLGMDSHASYVMGSLSPWSAESAILTVELCWPVWPPELGETAGLAFGQASDEPYLIHQPAAVAGYHLLLHPDGELVLHSRRAGQGEGTRLASVATRAVESGEWVSLTVRLDAAGVEVSRSGEAEWKLRVEDAGHRGGYLSLCKNYPAAKPVAFRSVSIS
ncbi:glycerophosphodiester phosphodiesterase [Specibacter sp. NPDC057265]|uniref:glycerophosphodiester phosphodiesterase n=1 Tax=Specibacter sp. NPDC057265 TaxID=3346075 RepID=UPI0036434549